MRSLICYGRLESLASRLAGLASQADKPRNYRDSLQTYCVTRERLCLCVFVSLYGDGAGARSEVLTFNLIDACSSLGKKAPRTWRKKQKTTNTGAMLDVFLCCSFYTSEYVQAFTSNSVFRL